MAERDALDGQRTVFVNNLMTRGIDLIELHLIAQVAAEELYLLAQHVAKGGRPVDMERRRTAEQSECGNHANETEAVIAMQMGDKHMAELGETGMTATQLHLRPLAAVNHHQLATNLDKL